MRIKYANIGTTPGFLEHSVVFAIISNLHSPPPRSDHGGFSSALEDTYPWKAVLFLCLRASRGKTDRLTLSRCLCVRNMGHKERRCIQIQGVGGFLRRSRLDLRIQQAGQRQVRQLERKRAWPGPVVGGAFVVCVCGGRRVGVTPGQGGKFLWGSKQV